MPTYSVQLKPQKTAVSSVTIGPRTTVTLGEIVGVTIGSPVNGDTLVYNASSGLFISQPIVITSNNISAISGGSF